LKTATNPHFGWTRIFAPWNSNSLSPKPFASSSVANSTKTEPLKSFEPGLFRRRTLFTCSTRQKRSVSDRQNLLKEKGVMCRRRHISCSATRQSERCQKSQQQSYDAAAIQAGLQRTANQQSNLSCLLQNLWKQPHLRTADETMSCRTPLAQWRRFDPETFS
jgi:hypothetical protein